MTGLSLCGWCTAALNNDSHACCPPYYCNVCDTCIAGGNAYKFDGEAWDKVENMNKAENAKCGLCGEDVVCGLCGEDVVFKRDPDDEPFYFCPSCCKSMTVSEVVMADDMDEPDTVDDDELSFDAALYDLLSMETNEIKTLVEHNDNQWGVVVMRVPSGWLYRWGGEMQFVPLPDGVEWLI